MKRAALALGALILSSCPALAQSDGVRPDGYLADDIWHSRCERMRPRAPHPGQLYGDEFDTFTRQGNIYRQCIGKQAKHDAEIAASRVLDAAARELIMAGHEEEKSTFGSAPK